MYIFIVCVLNEKENSLFVNNIRDSMLIIVKLITQNSFIRLKSLSIS